MRDRERDRHALLTAFNERFGAGMEDPAMGIVRFPCPVCDAGANDPDEMYLPGYVALNGDGPLVSCTEGCPESAIRRAIALRSSLEVGDESDESDESPLAHNPAGDFGRIGRFGRSPAWPRPLAPEALHGIAGDVVRALDPHTEADPAALLLQTLVAFGSAVGRETYVVAEGDRHPCGFYVLLVGDTAKGRKGTSWGRVRAVFELAAPEWLHACVTGGAVSGEGIIWEVRDPIIKQVPVMDGKRATGEFEEQTVDPGIDDKRRLWFAGEFASILNAASREKNTLSATLRELWDRGDMRTAAKNSPAQTTGAHTSLVGHITRDELRRLLTHTETVNGFINRFLQVCVTRSKCLPETSNPDPALVAELAEQLKQAIRYGSTVGEMKRDDEARKLWADVYPALSEGGRGLLGAATTRAEAYVNRLALAYALLDLSPAIRVEHLRAALAVWDYCYQSAAHLFGNALGDPDADAILQKLTEAGAKGLTRTEIRDLFAKHKTASTIDNALGTLRTARLVSMRREPTGGRPVERWFVGDQSGEGDRSQPGAGRHAPAFNGAAVEVAS